MNQFDYTTDDLSVFKDPYFGQIRALSVDGEPWFVGKDVADILGYQNASKALADHVDPEDKLNNESLLSLGQRGGWLINESGLYSLILSSKLPSARNFKRWITHEVIPAIRKTGGYIAGEKAMTDDELLTRGYEIAMRKIAERDKQIASQATHIEALKPKAMFADTVASSDGLILIRELAKVLYQAGYKTGEQRLYEELRQRGYLIRQRGASDYNLPTQRALDMGLFRVTESTHVNSRGNVMLTRTAKVTGKGQLYFVRLFAGGGSHEAV